MNTLTALVTGLGTGGLTCLAVQGGLLIGLLARQQTDDETSVPSWQRLILPVSGFLIAKIAVYSLFGFLLGTVGEKLQLSTTALAWLQGIAAIFMVITGIRLIWPQWLPWLNFTAPSGVRRFVRRRAKSELWIAPVVLGAATIFIPCGTTVAMEAAALGTANPWQAAGILFGFTLGTAPLFFIIGVLAKGTTLLQSRLKWVTAVLVVGIGLYSFNGVLTMIDSPYSWQSETAALRRALAGDSPSNVATAAVSNPTINVYPTGYEPSNVTVSAGQPVTVTLNAPGKLSCTSIFRIPKLNITKQLSPNSQTVFNATFDKGTYTFTCGMGMFSGTITAI